VRSIQFVTIVLNGKPFIQHHVMQFLQLSIPWHWHIVEGVADLVHDTAWSRAQGGSTDGIPHREGLSADGTSEYLDMIATKYPDRISIYRPAKGRFWAGKLAMVSAPLAAMNEDCLLWQIDADEFWTCSQISTLWSMFEQQPERTAARFYCSFYVGPHLVTDSINTYGNHADHGEWLRVWHYQPGDTWRSHEPPVLGRLLEPGLRCDVAAIYPFSQAETACNGLIFKHYAYIVEQQLAFKEKYYGYTGAVVTWQRLQQQQSFPLRLTDYFPWVQDETTVIPFFDTGAVQVILLVRTDALGDALLTSVILPHVASRFFAARLIVACRENLAELYYACPYISEVVPFDRVRASGDPVYLRQLVEALRGFRPDLAINASWSRDSLGDLLVLQSGASETLAHDGDLCNISADEKHRNDCQYRYLAVSAGGQQHELQRHAALLRVIGVTVQELIPQVWLSDDLRRRADHFFESSGLDPERTVALFVSGTWRGKCYLHYPEALGRLLQEKMLTVLLFGEEKDFAVHEDLLVKLGVPGINLAGRTTILEAAALLQRCRLAIGIDTGLAHLACAVGTRNVVLVGGYQFGRYFPYSSLTTVACLPLECWQCNGNCRYERAHCVFDLSPKVLYVAVQAALETTAENQPVVVAQGNGLWPDLPGRPGWRPLASLIVNGYWNVIEVP
jgi:ADP-heptose:LPS heptosyltransferase